jgi:4-amino-4-deoxy-L-arabinose transferase-like glycosyltransferase
VGYQITFNGMKFEKSKIAVELPVLFLALFNICIHLLVINNLEYHRDELLYFSLGQHPDFGFETVPPMIGWIAWFMQNVFGYSLFAVRLFPALLSGVMVLLVSAVARELGGSSYSRILASIGFVISVFALRTYSLYMPVHIDVFFWTLVIYMVLRYINTSSDKTLIWLGAVMGFSLLNKYLIGVLFLSLICIIPFTSNRKIFKNRNFWFGLSVGIIIFLPNLIWQFVNGLPVFSHLSELGRTQLVHVDRLAFLIDQLINPSWASVLTIAGLIYLFRDGDAMKFRFLGIVSILVIVLLCIMRGKGYYTIGLFPFLISAGAVSYEKWLERKWIRIAVPVLLILLTIPMLPFGLPVYKSDGMVAYFRILNLKYGITLGRRFEDGTIHSLPQDYADMIGWEELTAITARVYNSIEDKKACFIFGENYGYAGAITVIGKKYGLPEAVCFNESFRYWIPLKFDPDIKSFIYINGKLGGDIQKLFNKITLVGMISDPDSREYGTKVYLCENPNRSFNEFWRERLERLYISGH